MRSVLLALFMSGSSPVVAGADTIILAIHWAPAKEIIEKVGPLIGKVIIDPINPMEIGANRSIEPAVYLWRMPLKPWACCTLPKVIKAGNALNIICVCDNCTASLLSRLT